jgi:hypothetical protein
LATDDSRSTRVQALETFGRFPALLYTDADPARPGWAPAAPSATSQGTASSADGRLRVRAVDNRLVIQQRPAAQPEAVILAPSRMNALALDPSGRLLAAGISEQGFADSGSTLVWDVASGLELYRFDSGDGEVWAHRFSPDGSTVTAYGADGLHTWDLTGSRALIRLENGAPAAYRAGTALLSVTDGTARAWIEMACALAGRPLTRAEWSTFVGDTSYRPTCA